MFFLSPDPVEVVRVDGRGKERAGVLKWGTVSVAQEVSGRQYLVGARGIREGDSEGVTGERTEGFGKHSSEGWGARWARGTRPY